MRGVVVPQPRDRATKSNCRNLFLLIELGGAAAAKMDDEFVDCGLVVDDVDFAAEAAQFGVHETLTALEIATGALDFDEDGAGGGSDDDSVRYSASGWRDELQAEEAVLAAHTDKAALDRL